MAQDIPMDLKKWVIYEPSMYTSLPACCYRYTSVTFHPKIVSLKLNSEAPNVIKAMHGTSPQAVILQTKMVHLQLRVSTYTRKTPRAAGIQIVPAPSENNFPAK